LQRRWRSSRLNAAWLPALRRRARRRRLVCGTHLRLVLPRTLTFRPLTCFWTVSVAMPASLDVKVNEVP
jgi:hypothetical protein